MISIFDYIHWHSFKKEYFPISDNMKAWKQRSPDPACLKTWRWSHRALASVASLASRRFKMRITSFFATAKDMKKYHKKSCLFLVHRLGAYILCVLRTSKIWLPVCTSWAHLSLANHLANANLKTHGSGILKNHPSTKNNSTPQFQRILHRQKYYPLLNFKTYPLDNFIPYTTSKCSATQLAGDWDRSAFGLVLVHLCPSK